MKSVIKLLLFTLPFFVYASTDRMSIGNIRNYISAENELRILYGRYKTKTNFLSSDMLKAIDKVASGNPNKKFNIIFNEYDTFYYIAVLPQINTDLAMSKSRSYIIEKQSMQITAVREPTGE